MKFDRNHQSADVEDRRGTPAKRSAGVALGGVGGVLLLLIGTVIFGPEFLVAVGPAVMEPNNATQSSQRNTGSDADPKNDEGKAFVSFVLDDLQATWTKKFKDEGMTYSKAKLVLFEDAVESACGFQKAAVGPFYCPADRKAYIDLSFYKDLRDRFGAPGDFAQAYVIAHEIGHHIQNLTGTSARIHRAKQGASQKEANALSVQLELQADCYAGVWAHSTKQRDLLEKGDIEEGIRAAGAIGDDRLQSMAGRRVTPDSFTHGSSKQRIEAFTKGFKSGAMTVCDI